MGPREFFSCVICVMSHFLFSLNLTCLRDENKLKNVEIDWKLNQIYMFFGTVCQSDQLAIRLVLPLADEEAQDKLMCG